MLSNDEEALRDIGEDLSTQIAKTAVTEHDHAVGRAHLHLHEDLKCRCDGFSKNCYVVGQRIGNEMKIALRHDEVVRKRAVVTKDADDRAIGTVRGEIAQA